MCFEIQSIEENKTGSNKKQERNEFIKRDWKGISTKGFDDLKKKKKRFSNPLL